MSSGRCRGLPALVFIVQHGELCLSQVDEMTATSYSSLNSPSPHPPTVMAEEVLKNNSRKSSWRFIWDTRCSRSRSKKKIAAFSTRLDSTLLYPACCIYRPVCVYPMACSLSIYAPPPPPTPPPPRCWWHAPDGREKWGNGGIRSPTTKAKLVDPPAAAAAAQ
jgi:hypothetical protein